MAKKPRLSKNQQRQIAKNRQKRLSSNNNDIDNTAGLGEALQGRVVSRYGKHAVVECTDDKQQHKCFIRRTISSVVCGDLVQFRPSLDPSLAERGVIELVHDRKSTLGRPDYYDGVKPVAANVEQIIVVSSILPAFSSHIIDRYLVACEHAQITPVVLLNKVELADDKQLAQIEAELDVYRQLGYKVLLTSCETGVGIDELMQTLKHKTSVLVGQSGVGKSSLVNQLLPNSNEIVGEISDNSKLGQHTTTTAKLIPLPSGGDLIDSPGVREFGLWHLPTEDITQGFIEFRPLLGTCKFSDCSHINDPGCAIRENADNGSISMARYASYKKIIESLEQNRPNYIKQ